MNEFYVTLRSDQGKTEFPNNQVSEFRTRLPIPLEFKDPGWKVGLVSASIRSFPSPVKLNEILKPFVNRLANVTWWWKLKTQPQIKESSATSFRDQLYYDGIKDGVTFMKNLIYAIDQPMQRSRKEGMKTRDEKGRRYLVWKWEGDDLVINNEDVTSILTSNWRPLLQLDKNFALRMGWIKETSEGTFDSNRNLLMEHYHEIIPAPSDVVGHAFFEIGVSSIALSSLCSWRFVNLNSAFEKLLKSIHPPTLIFSLFFKFIPISRKALLWEKKSLKF